MGRTLPRYRIRWNLNNVQWRKVTIRYYVIRDGDTGAVYTPISPKIIAEGQRRFDEFYRRKVAETEFIKALNAKSICIDCGANVGDISEIMAKTGAKVYAFEPNPLCLARLEKTCEKYKNIELIKKGVAGQNTKCKLYHSEFTKYDKEIFSRSSSIYANKSNVSADNYTEIECIDLCEFIDNLKEPVDLLKMDVEGAEFDILYKMITQGTYKKVKTILVETHDDVIPDIVEKADIIRKLIREKNIQNIDLNWR